MPASPAEAATEGSEGKWSFGKGGGHETRDVRRRLVLAEARVQSRGGSELGTVAGAGAAREEEEAPASPTRAVGAKRRALGRVDLWG